MNNNLPLLPSNNEEATNIPPIDEYYKVNIDDMELQLLFRQQGARKTVFVVDATGKECGSIYIDEDENTMDDGYHEVFLSKVVHKPSCTIGSTMTRGLSTIKMLRSLMSFAVQKLPNRPYIVFTDDSHFDCVLPDERHKTEISLSLFHFILKGKTWYEEHFGAVLDEEDTVRINQINIANSKLNMKITGEFDSFWRRMLRLGHFLRHYKWFNDAREYIKTEFHRCVSENQTWRVFFQSIFGRTGVLARKFGEHIGCSLFQMMKAQIKYMFEIPEFEQTHWKVLKETIMMYPEFNLEIAPNANPVHVKKSETAEKLAWTTFYTVGGSFTRHGRTKFRKVPKGYGGVISFLATLPPKFRSPLYKMPSFTRNSRGRFAKKTASSRPRNARGRFSKKASSMRKRNSRGRFTRRR